MSPRNQIAGFNGNVVPKTTVVRKTQISQRNTVYDIYIFSADWSRREETDMGRVQIRTTLPDRVNGRTRTNTADEISGFIVTGLPIEHAFENKNTYHAISGNARITPFFFFI